MGRGWALGRTGERDGQTGVADGITVTFERVQEVM